MPVYARLKIIDCTQILRLRILCCSAIFRVALTGRSSPRIDWAGVTLIDDTGPFFGSIMAYDILATVAGGIAQPHRNFLCSAAKLPSMNGKHMLVPFFGQVRLWVFMLE